MAQRRVNDAQVERLLEAMKRDPKYRSQLAHRETERKGFAPGSADYKRTYNSTMRRFQRYVTEAGQKRSFARAPIEYQREVRRDAREIAVQAPEFVERRTVRQEHQREVFQREVERGRRDFSDFSPLSRTDGNDLRAIIAYHDGDLESVRESLNLTARSEPMLELTFDGVDVSNTRDARELVDNAGEWLDGLFSEDRQDIQDFSDWLRDQPDWMIQIVMDDLAAGETTFADWVDALANDGFDLDSITLSEFWALWREAYARAKK